MELWGKHMLGMVEYQNIVHQEFMEGIRDEKEGKLGFEPVNNPWICRRGQLTGNKPLHSFVDLILISENKYLHQELSRKV